MGHNMASRVLLTLLVYAASCRVIIGQFTIDKTSTSVSVCEADPPTTVIHTIEAQGGSRPYSFWITNSDVPFDMCVPDNVGKSENGTICISDTVDREAVLSYQLNIEAEDSSGSSDSATLRVTIADANDSPPQFYLTPETGIVDMLEGTSSASAKVADVVVRDPDDGFAGSVDCSLEGEESKLFQLDGAPDAAGYNGILKVKEALDYEESQIHVVNLVAADKGDTSTVFCGESISNKATSNVYVNVLDGPDTPPAFRKPQYTARIKENANVFTDEAGVYARDGDYGLNWDVEYSIIGGDSIFNIDSATGKLQVSGDVDRESDDVVGGIYTLVVKAVEIDPSSTTFEGFPGAQSSNVTVTIVVDDVNDNRPKFYNSSDYNLEVSTYSIEIPEDTQSAVPEFRIYIKDIDQDENAKCSLTLVDIEGESGEDSFGVSPSTITSQGAVTLQIKGNLDYEKRKEYNLRIIATETDGSGVKEADIVITLTDINDNFPKFSEEEFSVTIPEDSAPNTHVLDIEATDEDDGSYGNLTYSLLPADSFDIFSDNGTVYIKTDDLDREKRAEYYLTVRAVDGGGLVNTVQLTISLEDINDEAPQFQQPQYLVNWNENDADVSSISVSALDLDEVGSDNSKITIEFEDPNMKANYTIESAEGNGSVNGKIRPLASLDAEIIEGNCSNGIVEYIFGIIVRDHGEPQNTDRANVSVYLRDVNDNPPFFENTSYSGSVAEESSFDTVIVNISATDGDKCEPNNIVVYTVDEAFSDKFLIGQNDDESWSLRVKSDQLDRDDEDLYHVTIYAIDSGQPRLTATATVNVVITDINNKPPIFDVEESDAQINVVENTSINETIGTVVAFDADEDSDLVYSIDKVVCTDENEINLDSAECFSWFDVSTIDRRGEIYVASELDRETVERIALTVKVEDKNETEGTLQEDSWTIQIRIEDFNDNSPEFALPIPTFTVAEESEEGTVIGQLSATDKDSATDEIVFFTNDVYINISPGGQLQVGNRIDREGEPGEEFSAVIFAADNGKPNKTISVTVNFTVSDTNDHTPNFTNTSYTCEIEEGLPLDSKVCVITATDNDIGVNGKVYYSIPNSFVFKANRTTGLITSEAVFDREITDTYEIKFKAEDDAARGLSREAEVDVTINILDVDDNDPTYQDFDPQNMEIEEENEIGTVVGEVVKAFDKDTEEFQDNHYFLMYESESDPLRDAFALDDMTRMLTATQKLDREVEDSYVLYVLTTKNSSIASDIYTDKDDLLEVRVSITDINDNAPKFTQDVYTTDMQLDTQPSDTDVVASVRAIDPDSGENAALTYTIEEQSYIPQEGPTQTQLNIFVIRKTEQDGYIYLNGPIEADLGGRYELNVQAEDGKGLTDTAKVIVKIFDVTEIVIIESRIPVDELNENRAELEKDLEEALDADVVIDSILPHEFADGQAQSRATGGNETATTSDIYFHATEWNETTLIPAEEITAELDTVENNDFLVEWSIVSIASTDPEEPATTSETDLLKAVLVVAVCLMVVILIVYTTAFVCMRRSYKRKLKVSKATEDAARDTLHTYQTNKGDLNIPGTNRHAAGESTLYVENQKGNIDMQGWERFQESADDDNSIDDNEVDSPDSAISEGNQENGPNDNSWDDVEIDFPDNDEIDATNMAAALNAAKNRGGEENIILMFDNQAMQNTSL